MNCRYTLADAVAEVVAALVHLGTVAAAYHFCRAVDAVVSWWMGWQ